MSDVDYPIDLSPAPWNIYRGDQSRYPIADGTDDGSGFDLTTLGGTWTAALARTEDASKLAVTVDDSDAANGNLVLSLAGSDTATLSPQVNSAGQANQPDYILDVQVTGGPIDPLTVYRLPVFVTKDVTQ